MYIVAIAWLYVTLMMAITEKNVVAGVMTFVFYGVLPLALVLWLVGVPRRRLAKPDEETGETRDSSAPAANRESGSVPHEHMQQPDGTDSKRDE